MFVVDNVVDEDRHMVLANELEISGLDDISPPVPPHATPSLSSRTFCLLGNGERPQSLQLEYPHDVCS